MYYFKCEHTVSSIFTNEQPNIQKDEDLSQVTPIMVKQDLNPGCQRLIVSNPAPQR